jgi:prepilin-type N-terminal cleavage/methylation domain-containing protein
MKINLEKGFTLIETLVSIGIFLLIIIAVNTFAVDIFSFNRKIYKNIENTQDIKVFLQDFSREIRSMSISNTGAFPIVEAGTSSITFYSDSDSDDLKEEIKYYVQNDSLLKRVIVPNTNPINYSTSTAQITSVIEGIDTGINIFEYFDSSYAGTTTSIVHPVNPYVIKLIKVNISVEGKVFTTQVSIRNLKNI